MKELTAAFKTQAKKFQGPEDYEAALAEKKALTAKLLRKNSQRTWRTIDCSWILKKATQESRALNKKLRLKRDLEEAH